MTDIPYTERFVTKISRVLSALEIGSGTLDWLADRTRIPTNQVRQVLERLIETQRVYTYWKQGTRHYCLTKPNVTNPPALPIVRSVSPESIERQIPRPVCSLRCEALGICQALAGCRQSADGRNFQASGWSQTRSHFRVIDFNATPVIDLERTVA